MSGLIPNLEDAMHGAVFSPCRAYRYVLWRRWAKGPPLVFVGVNPSRADATDNDPTITRCIGFAHAFGYGALLMVNAYAYIATNPDALWTAPDPVGPDNDYTLRQLRHRVGSVVVAAWGVNCPRDRERQVLELIGGPVFCLGKTKDGYPRHPLFVRGDAELISYWTPGIGGNK